MNNDQHPLLGALGLCRKAGKLLHGYDRVQENALRGKVALVLLTSDASERTVSHMKDACDGIVACEQMPLTSADLAMLTPKPAAVFGVTDEHLAQLCANTFDEEDHDIWILNTKSLMLPRSSAYPLKGHRNRFRCDRHRLQDRRHV